MSANDRALTRAAAMARRILADIAFEVRGARVKAGLSQEMLGRRLGWSADKVWQIEHERLPSLSISDACVLGAALGFDLSARLYPNGSPIRDVAQARRLMTLLSHVAAPLTFRTDVALPAKPERDDHRAWDAVIYGHRERTGIELESRLGDVQGATRRHHLKRRDDPLEHFLLVLAGTPHNRRVITEFAALLPDLPRLRTSAVYRDLEQGRHPPTGLILI